MVVPLSQSDKYCQLPTVEVYTKLGPSYDVIPWSTYSGKIDDRGVNCGVPRICKSVVIRICQARILDQVFKETVGSAIPSL